MNQRDLKNFWSINELLEKRSEKEPRFVYLDDMAEDIKNK